MQTITPEQIQQVLNTPVEQVMSVYSGKLNKCACGCAGKHSYASAHQAAGSKNRGYEVADNEVNDKQVRKGLKFLKTNVASAHVLSDDCFTVDTETRTYVVYLVK